VLIDWCAFSSWWTLVVIELVSGFSSELKADTLQAQAPSSQELMICSSSLSTLTYSLLSFWWSFHSGFDPFANLPRSRFLKVDQWRVNFFICLHRAVQVQTRTHNFC
jgi:hypothetical protein